MKLKTKKGSSLILTILIMAAILSIAIGLSKLTIGELQLARDIPKSLISYYAAEAGVEYGLYYDRSIAGGEGGFNLSDCIDSPDDEICFEVEAEGVSPNRTIKSRGAYGDIERAIELTY